MRITVKELTRMDKMNEMNEIIDLKGYNPYCMNEGTLRDDDTIHLTIDEAIEIGIIKRGLCDEN